MRAKTILTSISAAALTAGAGIASAQPPSSYQQSQSWHNRSSSMTGMHKSQGMSRHIAYQAAAVLRTNSQSSQSSQSTIQRIPQEFVNAARCVAVFPSVSGSSSAGAQTSTGMTSGTTGTSTSASMSTSGSSGAMGMPSQNAGVVSCRNDSGKWQSSSPAFVTISSVHMMNGSGMSSGSMSGGTMQSGSNSAYPSSSAVGNPTVAESGTQTGTTTGTATSPTVAAGTTGNQMNTGKMSGMSTTNGNAIVLLFMSKDAADTLSNGSVHLGSDLDVAAGPTGSGAMSSSGSQTAPAPVLAYRSSQQSGFMGADVSGAKVSFDKQMNMQAYGSSTDPSDLLQGKAQSTTGSHRLITFNQALMQFAPPSQYNSSKSQIAK